MEMLNQGYCKRPGTLCSGPRRHYGSFVTNFNANARQDAIAAKSARLSRSNRSPAGRPIPAASIPANGNVDLTPRTDPALWGPHAWGVLHLYPAHSPDQFNRVAWQNVVSLIRRYLNPQFPTGCAQCHETMEQYIQSNSPTAVKTAYEAARWGWKLQNRVNVKLGKPEFNFTHASVRWGWPLNWGSTTAV